MESGKYRLAKRMRLAARIIVLIAIGFGGTMLIGEAIGEFLRGGWTVITEATPTDPGVLIFVIGAMALAGCILSWRRERLAGILLVSTAVAFGIHIGFLLGVIIYWFGQWWVCRISWLVHYSLPPGGCQGNHSPQSIHGRRSLL